MRRKLDKWILPIILTFLMILTIWIWYEGLILYEKNKDVEFHYKNRHEKLQERLRLHE